MLENANPDPNIAYFGALWNISEGQVQLVSQIWIWILFVKILTNLLEYSNKFKYFKIIKSQVTATYHFEDCGKDIKTFLLFFIILIKLNIWRKTYSWLNIHKYILIFATFWPVTCQMSHIIFCVCGASQWRVCNQQGQGGQRVHCFQRVP